MFATLLLLSCERRELTYGYNTYDVLVNVDWSALEQKQGEAPSGMSVIFYPQQGGKAIVTQTNKINKATIGLPAGRYDVLVFNQIPSDFGTIGFRGMDKFETSEVFVKPTDGKWYESKGDGDIVARQPEYLAVATYLDFEINNELVEASTRHNDKNELFLTIDFEPEVFVKDMKAQVRIVGIHNLRAVRATVKGMSTGCHFATHESCASMTIHLLETWEAAKYEGQDKEGEITAIFTSFGLPNHHAHTKSDDDWLGSFDFELLLVDNKTVVKETVYFSEKLITNKETRNSVALLSGEHDIDQTIKIGLSADADDKPIILPDVDPEVPDGDGDWDVDLGDWDDEDIIDIPL